MKQGIIALNFRAVVTNNNTDGRDDRALPLAAGGQDCSIA